MRSWGMNRKIDERNALGGRRVAIRIFVEFEVRQRREHEAVDGGEGNGIEAFLMRLQEINDRILRHADHPFVCGILSYLITLHGKERVQAFERIP